MKSKWMDMVVIVGVIWTGLTLLLVYEDTIAKMYGHPSLVDYIKNLWK